MMPLALALRAQGRVVRGSDRGRDQGRTPERFAFLESQGIELFPQDGSGITKDLDCVVVSSAVEKTVPDYQEAERHHIPVILRAHLLARLFNAAETSIAIAGTSGKSTTTGMIGWILHATGHKPTVINGAAMKNFITPETPFASAVVGSSSLFVAEVDESDGSIEAFSPRIAVLNNIAHDHKSMDELRILFRRYIHKAEHIVLNRDNAETRALETPDLGARVLSYSLEDAAATLFGANFAFTPHGVAFDVIYKPATNPAGEKTRLHLGVAGRHNAANALAALAACCAHGVPFVEAVKALQSFAGIARRMDVIGTANGITVIDDFAHNPDKIAACLRSLHLFSPRLLILFQPHGYGPLRLMKDDFVACFSEHLGPDDHLCLCDPLYLGGTTDRSVTSADLVADLVARGASASSFPARDACAADLCARARSGDTILILGARDDTLPAFAQQVLHLCATKHADERA